MLGRKRQRQFFIIKTIYSKRISGKRPYCANLSAISKKRPSRSFCHAPRNIDYCVGCKAELHFTILAENSQYCAHCLPDIQYDKEIEEFCRLLIQLATDGRKQYLHLYGDQNADAVDTHHTPAARW